MSTTRHPRHRCLVSAALLCLLLDAATALASSPEVVTKGRLRVGEPVIISFTFKGLGRVVPLEKIDADGLQFELQKSLPLPEKSVPDHGWQHRYVAVPQAPGRYRIPEQVWTTGTGRITSKGRTISVSRGSIAPVAPESSPVASSAEPKVACPADQEQWLRRRFAETATSASTPEDIRVHRPPQVDPPHFFATAPAFLDQSARVYVGQVVPLEVQFYLRADKNFEDLLRPGFSGRGFISGPVEELPPGVPATVQTNGAHYHVITLQTSVTPLRAGLVEIPPMVLRGRYAPLTRLGAGAAPDWKQFTLPTESLPLEVSPLPEDRPPDFTGGVGSFQAVAPDVFPQPPRPGEPLNLRFKVEGRGNFAALQRPVLASGSEDGWRIYGGSEVVETEDAVGRGAKTFEMPLVAVVDQDRTPSASLSYFDPHLEKFMSLEFPSVPLPVILGVAPVPVTEETEVPVLTDVPPEPPAYFAYAANPWFYLLGGFLTFALAAWFGVMVARRQAVRSSDLRTSRLLSAYQEACQALADAGPGRAEFYTAAAAVIRARLAQLRGSDPGVRDAEDMLGRLVGDPDLRDELRMVLQTSDELHYGAAAGMPWGSGERVRVTEAMRRFDAATQ